MITKRGKGKLNSTYNARSMYIWAGLEIDYKEYMLILRTFNKLISKLILDGEEVSLGLGKFSIVKVKDGKKRAVDFGMTRKLGKTIYHLNTHTRGFHYKWKWSKLGYNISNKSKYLYRTTRTNNRELSRKIKLERRDYL